MAAATVVSPRISPQEVTRPVGGDHDRGLQVALRDDLEQRGGGLGGQRQVAEFVDHEQRRAGVEAHGGGPAAFDRGAVAAGGEVGGGGEVGAVAGLDGCGPARRRAWSCRRRVVRSGARWWRSRGSGRWRGRRSGVGRRRVGRRSRSPPGWPGWVGRRTGAGRRAAGFGGVDLEAQQPFQRGRSGSASRRWLGRGRRGVLGGGGQLQRGEMSAQLLVARGLGCARRCGTRRSFSATVVVLLVMAGCFLSRGGGVGGEVDDGLASAARLVAAAQDRRRRRGRPAPGGMRSLRRCGGAVVNAASAAVVDAVTWVSVRIVTPAPSAARRCRAITTLSRSRRWRCRARRCRGGR